MTINTTYVAWLVDWIKRGVLNVRTNASFAITDVTNTDYKAAVIAEFAAQVSAGTITAAQYQTYTGTAYSAG